MPASVYPVLPHYKSYPVVQLKCFNRGAPACGAPHDACAIFAPAEVAVPPLGPGVEKANPSVVCGIATFGLDALRVVAEATGKPQVVVAVTATSHRGDNMLNFQNLQDMFLPREAIAAAITGSPRGCVLPH